jgi:tRNA (cmo5U34)-methyltransferase
MRAITRQRLAPFGRRATVEAFELTATDWYAHLQHTEAVLSSLCLHHLSGPQKQALFAEIHRRTSPQAALLIADLVAPQRPEANALFAAAWDKAALTQAQSHANSAHGFTLFQQAQWNLYHYPDPVDRPSPLFEQLQWLAAAGFTVVDCFWMQAGHAIYGGYKASAVASQTPPAFETILKQVEMQLNAAASA